MESSVRLNGLLTGDGNVVHSGDEPRIGQAPGADLRGSRAFGARPPRGDHGRTLDRSLERLFEGQAAVSLRGGSPAPPDCSSDDAGKPAAVAVLGPRYAMRKHESVLRQARLARHRCAQRLRTVHSSATLQRVRRSRTRQALIAENAIEEIQRRPPGGRLAKGRQNVGRETSILIPCRSRRKHIQQSARLHRIRGSGRP